ncbi:hypothetical protein BZA05DRAFT_35919 [Tricharina praecox]|uniref:uncharacterized protein n=1 Tax=Tricharina praecox TaxID=43433 RepID=UPI00221E40AF|nr:uncharacterized protein BZA05DRAFT_35919 [Tricharina praecox]KAI5852128.1 hypothetical protein BZA05DRAFT_35919 [Tricharina praecox]
MRSMHAFGFFVSFPLPFPFFFLFLSLFFARVFLGRTGRFGDPFFFLPFFLFFFLCAPSSSSTRRTILTLRWTVAG